MTYVRSALTLAAALLLGTGSHAADRQLTPARALPKKPTATLIMPSTATGVLIVKFRDEVRARATADGGLRATQAVPAATAILQSFGLTARTAFKGFTEEQIAAVEARAAARSGKAQPDLAGMLHLTGPEENLEAAAKALNQLDSVEWIKFELEKTSGSDVAIGMTNKRRAEVAAQLRADRAKGKTGAAKQTQGDGLSLGSGDDGNDPLEAEEGVLGCCLPTGQCLDLNLSDCITQGGVRQPRVCTGNFCGACCTDTGCVDSIDTTVCTMDFMGTYEGNLSDCTTVCLPGACCLPGDLCVEAATQVLCESAPPVGQGGFWQGSGVLCEDAECDTECGQSNQNCWDPDGFAAPYCEDMDCCNLVCDIDPRCCDNDPGAGGAWDAFCASTANALCGTHTPNWDPVTMMPINDPPLGPDRCVAGPNGNGGCFTESEQGGCNNQICCNSVCLLDEFCCSTGWDPLCVNNARGVCADPGGGGTTPPLDHLQGYLTGAPYGILPIELQPYVPNTAGIARPGFTGEGMTLNEPGEPWTDVNGDQWYDETEPFDDFGRDGVPATGDFGEGNGRWDPPSGLRGVAEQLLRAFHIDGTGQGNLTSGKTIKVAVIEAGFWPGHEDLTHIKVERGQTIIEIPEVAENDHGTACLSVLNAADNGIGVTGIVPEAEGWFFPTTSVEDGPREPAAWLAAMTELDEGDVISASYGPRFVIGPLAYNLNNELEIFTLIEVASDIGITVCVQSGDFCVNLDDDPDLGDANDRPRGMVVGYCSPGFPWYRLPESNYCTNPDAGNIRSNVVHFKAWGEYVVAAGYGDLFSSPDSDPKRSYTATGLSASGAACVQVAGLSAALQGLAKQFYGLAISPEFLRFNMGAPGAIPNSPAPVLFGGFNPDFGCALDLNPDLGPNMIGEFVRTLFAVDNITSEDFGGFRDSPRLDDVLIVRGKNIKGNRFSVKGRDDRYLKYDAIYTKPGDGPVSETGLGGGISGGVPIPQIHDINYITAGDITDLVFIGHADIDNVNTLIIENHLQYPNVFNVIVVELYDHRREEFVFIDIVTDPGQAFLVEAGSGDLIFAHVADASGRFIQRGTNSIVGRIWSVGFPNVTQIGFGGSGDDNYRMQIDLLNIFVSENFGEQLPGGGG